MLQCVSAFRAKTRSAGSAISELQELSEQYEDIMEDCGHGRFQWTLFMVLGLALMADGVECFVVAFALPSAEKDLCLSNAEKGMLGKGCINVFVQTCPAICNCIFCRDTLLFSDFSEIPPQRQEYNQY